MQQRKATTAEERTSVITENDKIIFYSEENQINELLNVGEK